MGAGLFAYFGCGINAISSGYALFMVITGASLFVLDVLALYLLHKNAEKKTAINQLTIATESQDQLLNVALSSIVADALEAVDGKGKTPLAEAIYYGNADAVRELLERGAKIDTILEGQSYFHEAADKGNAEVMAILLVDLENREEKLSDLINEPDPWGQTPLFHAVLYSEPTGGLPSTKYQASKEEKLATVELLLQVRADINAKDKDGTSVLKHAALNGTCEIVQALVNNGAKCDFPLDDISEEIREILLPPPATTEP